MPDICYFLARAKGTIVRAWYNSLLSVIVRVPVRANRTVKVHVFAYSNEAMLPEQVASIRSFLRHVGRPIAYTVVSDGSHSHRSATLLRRLDSSVKVASAVDWIPPGAPHGMRDYLTSHPTGRQLGLIMCLPLAESAMYVDADVLFYPGARELARLVASESSSASFLQDCQFAGDTRLIRAEREKQTPVNTGFLILRKPLDWSLGVARFLELEGAPSFFTNQTITHLVMHANGANALAREKFILELDDQCDYGDRHANADVAIRHYVNPVRHKFWTSLFP